MTDSSVVLRGIDARTFSEMESFVKDLEARPVERPLARRDVRRPPVLGRFLHQRARHRRPDPPPGEDHQGDADPAAAADDVEGEAAQVLRLLAGGAGVSTGSDHAFAGGHRDGLGAAVHAELAACRGNLKWWSHDRPLYH